MLDIAHAILQNGEGFQERATDAFQEIVSDLYDGYLSDARRSAEVVPEAIVRTRVGSLENHALGDIQGWRDVDQKIVEDMQAALRDPDAPLGCQKAGMFAAHAVAGTAVTTAVSQGGHIPLIFDRMVTVLKGMHNANASWGPLFIRHPGNVFRHRAYSGAA